MRQSDIFLTSVFKLYFENWIVTRTVSICLGVKRKMLAMGSNERLQMEIFNIAVI